MTDSSEMFLFHGCSQEGDPWDSGQYLVELREGEGSLQELLSLSPLWRGIRTNQNKAWFYNNISDTTEILKALLKRGIRAPKHQHSSKTTKLVNCSIWHLA